MEGIQKVDLTKIKPYGDTLNDGMVQMSLHCLFHTAMKQVKQRNN